MTCTFNPALHPMLYQTARIVLMMAVLTLLSACETHRLLPDSEKARESALPPAEAGPLYELSRKMARPEAAGEAHFLPVSSNTEALRWRLLLTDLAQRSIDIQYYLIDQDESSRLLSMHLMRAADRGGAHPYSGG